MKHHVQTATFIAGMMSALSVLPISSGPAFAGINELKAHMISQSTGNPPYMDMHYVNGKWVWKNQNKEFWPKIKIKMTSSPRRIKDGNVTLHAAGSKNVAGVLWTWRVGKQHKFEGSTGVRIAKAHLQGSVNSAAALCHMSGGSKKVTRQLDLPLAINAIATKGGWVKRWGSFPVRVICNAKPAGPSKTPMKLSQVKLYTAPGQPKCGAKTLMVAEFWADRPGKVNFIYQRDDGEKANGSVQVKKLRGGYAGTWHRVYQFNQSVNRRYMIIVKGHPLSTNWVPLKVNCGVVANPKRPAKVKG